MANKEEKPLKIVFLDRKTLGDDLLLDKFRDFGEVEFFDFTKEEEIGERTKDADIIIVNKIAVNEKTMSKAENLKIVLVTATGTDNIDKEYLASRAVEWRNVTNYSTESVAQHTLSMVLYLYEHLKYYDNYTSGGHYINDSSFTHFGKTFHEINGKTWGIIGLGNIGKRVAEIAECLGAKIIYYSASSKRQDVPYKMADFETLLRESDIITIHAPLNSKTRGLMDKEAFKKMKKEAILVNTGRGPIINETDLCEALLNGEISSCGIDVLCREPMDMKSPLIKLLGSEKLFITPHIAWAGTEARNRLMDTVYNQIKDFLDSGKKYERF